MCYQLQQQRRLSPAALNQLHSFSESICLLSGATNLTFTVQSADQLARLLKKTLDSDVAISVSVLRKLLCKLIPSLEFSTPCDAQSPPLNADLNNLNFLLNTTVGFYHHERLLSARENTLLQLRALGVDERISEEGLAWQIAELNEVIDHCQSLQTQLDTLSNTLPAGLVSCCQLTDNGLTQLASIISLTSMLAAPLWPLRHDSFNSYAMDLRLEMLQQRDSVLTPLRAKLVSYVDTSALENSQRLSKLHQQMQRSGLLRWFSSDWRAARRNTLALSVNSKLALSDLCMLFPAMHKCSVIQAEQQALLAQEPVLSHISLPLAEQLTPYLALCQWYKEAGFIGADIFADAALFMQGISELKPDIATQLQQEYSANLTEQVTCLGRKITKLRLVFSGYAPLQQADGRYLSALQKLQTILSDIVTTLADTRQA